MSVANTIRRALGLSTKIGFPLFDAQVGFEKAVFELLSDWDRVAAVILVSNIKHELATRGPTAQVILEIHQMNLAALRQLYGRTLPMRGVFDDELSPADRLEPDLGLKLDHVLVRLLSRIAVRLDDVGSGHQRGVPWPCPSQYHLVAINVV